MGPRSLRPAAPADRRVTRAHTLRLWHAPRHFVGRAFHCAGREVYGSHPVLLQRCGALVRPVSPSSSTSCRVPIRPCTFAQTLLPRGPAQLQLPRRSKTLH